MLSWRSMAQFLRVTRVRIWIALYLAVCCSLGLCISVWAGSTSAALLGGLLAWMVLVLLLPLMTGATVKGLFPIPSAQKIEAQKAGLWLAEDQHIDRKVGHYRPG